MLSSFFMVIDDLLGEEGPGLVPGSSRETENNTDVPMTDPGEAQKMQDDKPPEEGQKKKRKRRKKDEIATGEKPKRKRKKKEKVEGDGEDSEKKKQDKFARRNIRLVGVWKLSRNGFWKSISCTPDTVI